MRGQTFSSQQKVNANLFSPKPSALNYCKSTLSEFNSYPNIKLMHVFLNELFQKFANWSWVQLQ